MSGYDKNKFLNNSQSKKKTKPIAFSKTKCFFTKAKKAKIKRKTRLKIKLKVKIKDKR